MIISIKKNKKFQIHHPLVRSYRQKKTHMLFGEKIMKKKTKQQKNSQQKRIIDYNHQLHLKL